MTDPKTPSRNKVRDELCKLIESIGGEGVLLLLLEDFYQRMSEDVLIGFFFTGKNLAEIALRQSQFILNAAGLTKDFSGKGPATAHLHLAPILSGHFDRRLVILRETLTEAHLAPADIDLWLHFEEGFRAMVVTHK